MWRPSIRRRLVALTTIIPLLVMMLMGGLILGTSENRRLAVCCCYLIGAIIAWLAATFATRKMLGRVTQFIHEAEQMGEVDLSRRLPVEGKNEFAQLAMTFNELLESLEAAFNRQAEALEEQRRFTANASHELKTPLTTIKGTASMALVNPGSDERSRAAFSEINRATDVMVRLVQDLLYLARADAGALPMERQRILVVEILDRARAAVDPIDGGEVEMLSDDFDATLWGSEPELIRLFTNLLSNARRHTPRSGWVKVCTTTSQGMTEVVVQDNGCGIAPEHLPLLGQRFYRADISRARNGDEPDGTGLGLAIVAEIVRAHQGTIAFQSTLAAGTSVTVRIPNTN